MKLRTSFFNGSVLRKDLSRFAPVWGLYALGLFLVMSTLYETRPAYMMQSLAETLNALSYVNWAYAFLCATMLFGDLFQSRMCNALHAMPMRRDGWFFTHVVAGVLFALIPNVLLTTVAAVLLRSYAFMAFWWLLCAMGQFLFHFALAALCVMCVGNRFAHALVYGILSFLPMIVNWLVIIFYEPLLYGISIDSDSFLFACPTTYMGLNDFFQWDYNVSYYNFHGLESDMWIYLAACAGIGILLLLLALLVYRRRNLETAGDFIALKKLSPVFLLLYTMIAGAVFYTFGELFTDGAQYIFLFIGLITGFYTGRMLLVRSLRVFRWKSNLACFLLLIVFSGTLVLTSLDPLGLTKWVPKTQDVKSASIAVSDSNSPKHPMTDVEDIEAVTSIHRQLLDHALYEKYGHAVDISYTLKNGRTVHRTYQLSSLGQPLESKLAPITSRWETVMQGIPREELLDRIFYVCTSTNENLPSEAYAELLNAIAQDCVDGNMSQSYALHENEGLESWLEISYHEADGSNNHVYLDIFECCTNTIAVLEKYASAEYNGKMGY